MIFADIAPVGKFNRHFLTLLQENYIRRYLRAGVRLESVVRQTDSAHKIGTFRKVFTNFRVLLIQSTLCSDESYNAVRRYFIQRFCEKIVVYQEILLVVPLVEHSVISERNIADSGVKIIVGECSFLIPLYLNICHLIELLCDTSGYAVQFNAVQTAFLTHFFGHNAEKVAYAHSRLQNVTSTETESRQSLINAVYDGGRGVVRVQHRAFGGCVFVLCQRFHKFLMFARPGTVILVKRLRKSAPADVL